MAIFGLLLILLGVIIILIGIFALDVVSHGSYLTTQIMGFDAKPQTVFFMGLVAGVLIILGMWFVKTGAKQGLKHRKERKQLNQLSDKLDKAEREKLADQLDDND